MTKWKKRLFNAAIMAFLSLALLEVVYRYQVIDFYATEFQFLNPDWESEREKPQVLVMGDSFTASDSNYVEELRRQFPEVDWVNSSVPGTGIIQAEYMARRRFRRVEPDYLVYQIYLGNDLFDIRNPIAWSELGWARSIYWSISNRFRSIGYLNYKMGQFMAAPPDTAKMVHMDFSEARFNPREKMYLRAEPDWLTAQLSVGEEWSGDVGSYLTYLEDLMGRAAEENIPALVMVIPHFAQVHRGYFDRLELLGGKNDSEVVLDVTPPLWRRLDSTLGQFPNVDARFLLPAFRSDSQAIYFPNDPHLTPHGQRVVAAEVAHWFRTVAP